MKRLLLILMLLTSMKSFSFHIVGGELEFITLSAGQYRIRVIQYFDEAQQNNPGPEGLVQVYIFSNSTDQVVSTHNLPIVEQADVQYTNIACAIDELQTSRVVWSADFELDPADYQDPNGYYLVWERCCRNGDIVNIVNPLGSGMKYVLEIPPLMKDGQPFINSSPVLFSPLSDYACVDQLYYVDFTGTDLDGDSLAYTLTTPLNSSANIAVPVPQPKPHLPLFFNTGFDEKNMVPGSPSLGISEGGLLTVEPFEKGLYVFSVLVEEFREGEKIGEVRRDFQMLVVDGCNPPEPPDVGVRIPGKPAFKVGTDTLTYTLVDDKCFEFTVTNITPGETISFRAEPVNFEGNVDDIFTVKQQFVGSGVDTLLIEVCAPGCPPLGEDPFIIDLIAADDACPLPQLDTLRLTMQVEPPSNALPISDLVSGSIIVDENDVFVRDFVGTDADDHLMYFALTVEGVENPSEIGLTLETTSSVAGDIGGRLTWDTNCLENDFAESQVFRVGLRVEDLDECDYENPNVIWLDLEVILPPNTNPEVSFLSTSITEIDVTYGDILEYTAVIDDADDDQVSLILAGKEFVPTDFGVQFNPSSGQGKASSNFRWDIDCGLFNLLGEETYTFYFIGDDTDKCQVKNFDTLTLVVNLSQPVNNQPLILEQPDYRLKVNEPFSLLMIANDMDVDDVISLSFFDGARLPSSSSLRFPGATGKGTVSSTLEWTPECNLINPDGSSKTYELVFLATDDICPISKFDTDTITFEIFQDRENFERFLPPNVFTPNGDDVNEVFSMTNLDEPLSDLPIDNCDDRFEYVSIHDRAGKRVFFSETRDFRWDGGDFPVGTYFYVVKYQRTEYNGYVQLVR